MMKWKLRIVIMIFLCAGATELMAGVGDGFRFFSGLHYSGNSYSGYYGKVHEDFADNSYDVSHLSFAVTPIGLSFPIADGLFLQPYISEIFERYAHFAYGNETSMYASVSSINLDLLYKFRAVKPGFFISAGPQISYSAIFTNAHIDDIYAPGIGIRAGAGCLLPIFKSKELALGVYYNYMLMEDVTIYNLMAGLNFYW